MSKEREAFEGVFPCSTGTVLNEYGHYESQINQQDAIIQNISWVVWQAAKTQAVPDQLDVNSILHDIDCYFDNSLSNTERTANNLLQSIYEKLSGEVKAQQPSSTSGCPDEP